MTFGEKSLKAAMNSYSSVLKFCSIPAVTVGDYHSSDVPGIFWQGETPWEKSEPRSQRFYAGRVKPWLYNYTPFENTLYLDADTEAKGSIESGFALLETADILIADDGRKMEGLFRHSKPGPTWDWIRKERDFTHDFIGKASNNQINTGAIFFKKSRQAHVFFANWYKEWLRFGKWDEQFSFMRAEHICKKAVITHLPPIWNTNDPDTPDIIIYHMWGLQKARDLYA
jgi:hypothetical protein